MAIEAGRVLSERYRLIRPVGQGSQASVWVAEHLALTTHVAVKLISQELAKKDSARERFRREATAAAQLRSAHVVQILDHGIDGDQPFIVMELLDGEDLFERLAHRGRLSLRETSKIVTQVARALSRAHAAGIVHRDLKPENVFLCPNDDDEVVKVLDFGVAKVKDAAKVTMQKTGVGTLIGTPHYMSPEQVKGIGETNFHTDLWALGVIAFQCITGELPFDSEGVGDLLIKITLAEAPVPSSVYPGAAPNFDQWFAKACAKDPKKRFQSAREMAMALAGVVGVIDGVATRAPTVRPPPAASQTATLKDARHATAEELEADDWEEIGIDEPPPKPAPKGAPRPAVPGAPTPRSELATEPAERTVVAPEGAEGQEIVDFDETIPADSAGVPEMVRAQHAAWEASQTAAAKARASVSTGSPGGAPEPPPARAPQISVVLPDNGANAPWDAGQGPPKPPASRAGSVGSTTHPTAVPVVTQIDGHTRALALIADEPEFDGTSRRRRMVRVMVAALVVSAIGITVTVVRSQLDLGPDSQPSAVPAAPPAPTPTVTEAPVPTPTATATVDSGKPVRPTKPVATANVKPTTAPTFKAPGPRKIPRPNDGTIVIPEPDEESVPPAP